MKSYYHWISCTGTWLLSDRLWSLIPLQNHLLLPWSLEFMMFMLGGWSACLVLHVLGDWFFLQDLIGLVLGLHFLYFICLWFFYLGWLLRHLPRHCFPRMVGPFPFLESLNFLYKNIELTLLFLFGVGHNPARFLVVNNTVVVVTVFKNYFIVRFLRKNEHHFPGWSYFSSYFTLPWYFEHPIRILSDFHDDVCTWIVPTPHKLDGLQWLHDFASSLLLHKFGCTSPFCIGLSQILSFLTSWRFLFPWMTMYVYDFFLPTF